MTDVDLVALQVIGGAEFDEDIASGVVDSNFHIVEIGEVDLAQVLGITGSTGIELANEFVVRPHPRGSCGKRLAEVHSEDDRERKFVIAGQIHQRAPSVDQRNARSDAGEGYGGALVDFYLQAVG